VDITCPLGEMHVTVSAGNTICVKGTLPGTAEPDALPRTIRVRVVAGHIVPPPPEPEPRQPGDVDIAAAIAWCAQNVPVPPPAGSGEPITVIAWAKLGRGNWSHPHSAQCFAGGPDPVDCCVGCT
jgi:hypothetical protein